ncbi:prefoldin subunit beta [Candidatus Woesearchaeota archaeon]|nr:prefoldin subunit beta [Candidatus Woesearchaeota archaeon]
MPKEVEQDVAQLQIIEQNLNNFVLQKQTFQAQLMEVESALKEIEVVDSAYKIVGTIMINVKSKDLKKELAEKQEMLDLRVKNLEKQENKLKDKAQEIQERVLKQMKDKDERS